MGYDKLLGYPDIAPEAPEPDEIDYENPPNTPETEEVDDDETDISADESDETLASDSDQSGDESETVEDAAFLDDTEEPDANASSSALLQRNLDQDDAEFMNR